MIAVDVEATKVEASVLLNGLSTTVRETITSLLGGQGNPKAIEQLTSSPPDVQRDVQVFLAFAFGLFLLNWIGRLVILEPVVRLMFPKMQPGVQVRKCSQAVEEAIFYGAFTIVGLCVVPSQPWVWPSQSWWIGFADGSHASMRCDLRCYYMLYIARYFQMAISVILEPKRKDFVEMFVHHLATVAVICVSYVWGWNRVGVVSMVIFDIPDLPLHSAKFCKYAAEATDGSFWRFCADRLFEAFATTFFLTHIVMFGYVVWSASIEGTRHCPNAGGPPGWTCIALLYMLLVLQFYWFYLILKVAIKIQGGDSTAAELEDLRSDDETDDKEQKESVWKNLMPLFLLCAAAPVGYLCKDCFNEATRTEFVLLLDALKASITRSASVTSLPMGPPEATRDLNVVGLLTIIFFFLTWGIRLIIVEPLVRRVLWRMKRGQVQKFAQSVMEVANYGSFALLGVLVVPMQPWVWPSANWWIGFDKGGHEIMRIDMRCYYLMYIARYTCGCASVLLEAKRKDFVEMMVHHLVTIAVCVISYAYGWNRVGVVVMVVFDPADVPLHVAKICKYTAESCTRASWSRFYQFIADRMFEIFAVVFFITRLVVYSYICWSAHIESLRYFSHGVPEWTCVILLYVLLLLQIFWFGLIVKVAVKLLRGASVEDVRSDDEDESAEPAGNGKEGKKTK